MNGGGDGTRSIGSLRITVVREPLPGRVRFRVDGVKRNPQAATRLRARIEALRGVYAAHVSPLTGNVLLRHRPDVPAQALLAALGGGGPGPEGARGPGDPVHTPWHAREADALVAHLATDPERGLATAEALRRLQHHGTNRLTEARAGGPLGGLLGQFASLPVALLGGSAALSLAARAPLDAAVTLAVVAVNAAIGFTTERGAAALIARFAEADGQGATALRDGAERRVPAETLVPGDVIALRPGDPVPADARVLADMHLSADESRLTGESLPERKGAAAALPAPTPLGDRRNMLHLGTTISGGSGRALVVATGDDTEIGRIQRLAGSVRAPRTAIEQDLDRLGIEATAGILVVAGATFGLGVLRGHPPLRILNAAIALAVAAVPEGLPAVATTTLALGLRRLRRQHLLVRRLAAVETLGSATVVCLDKTGTLTENRMRVVAALRGCADVRGRGAPRPLDGALQGLAHTALLAAEAPLDPQAPDARSLSGTERALADFAASLGVDRGVLARRHPQRHLRHRDEAHNYVVALCPDGARPSLAVKGRPAEVLAQCAWSLEDGRRVPLTAAMRDAVLRSNDAFGAQGLRVLGCAGAEGPGELRARYDALTWHGLVALEDPVRPGVAALVQRFQRAGIRTVMITGDQQQTAVRVGETLRLAGDAPLQVLDAERLEAVAPDVLAALAARTHVFARISPARKLEIVQALQRSGHTVVMTGDGINDGPALQAADVGIAMGRDGTRVARDVADVVIEDDDLRHILAGVAQGRTILANIRKSVHFLLATNLSEVLLIAAEVLRGPREVETPMELLWINLVTDVLPGLGLAVEPTEPGVLDRPPPGRAQRLTSPAYYRRLAVEAAVLGAGGLAAHAWGMARHGPGPRTRTITGLALVTGQLLHALNCRADRFHPVGVRDLFANPALTGSLAGAFALQGLPLVFRPLGRLLGLGPISGRDLAVAGIAGVGTFAANELILARRGCPHAPETDEGDARA